MGATSRQHWKGYMVPIGDSGQAATPKVGWRIARMSGANMPVAPAVVAFTLGDVWHRRARLRMR